MTSPVDDAGEERARGERAGRVFLVYRCPGCDYEYSEAKGEPREGFPAGTTWDDVPDDWCCPDCAVREKPDFEGVAT